MTLPATPRRLRCALVLCASLALGSAWAQTADDTRIGTFKNVQGDVRVIGRDGRTQPGDGVRAGDRLQTGRQGSASVVLRDGTVLTVGPGSEMDLSQFEYNATTQEGNALLKLLRGSVRVVTGLLAKTQPERFQVRTPTALVGVRGTDFIVEANPPVEHLHVALRKHWLDHSRLRR